MSDIQEWAEEARGWIGAMCPTNTQEYALASIANSLYVIARVIADLDEVEAMYSVKKEEK